MFLFFSQLPWATLFGLEDTVHTNMAITSAFTLAVDIVTRAVSKISDAIKAQGPGELIKPATG